MTASPAPKVLIPPNSKDSEMMVLGSMLTNINSLNVAADILDDNDFYLSEHKIIFQILKTAYKADKPADVHLVCEELKRQNKLQVVGGINYVTTLAQYAGTAAYVEEYAQLVKNKSLLRRMIYTAQDVEKQALADPSDVYGLLDDTQQKFFTISQVANPNAGILVKDLLTGTKSASRLPYLKELQERQEQYQKKGGVGQEVTGMPTHFIDVDKLLGGFAPSNLMILAARPAMGKTALALNIAENICFKNDVPVGIFSLEMTAEQLLHRMICSQAEIESEKIKTGALSGLDFQKIVEIVNTMQKNTMIIDDQPGLKITDLRARARRMKEAHQIGFLVIDYLQLISGSGMIRNPENRQLEISEISRMLKNLARELNVPILCLSQLSRKVEERTGHRPMMSDLRESGCLAGDTFIQDATTGKRFTIKELAERKEQTPLFIYGVDKDLKLGQHKMTKVFYSGKKQVFELKTRTGRTIKASANHPFLKLEGWTRLDKLTMGDRIALPREIACKQDASIMKNEELVLLGHLLGDGCILANQPYHYTSADEENIQTVSQSSHKLFGIQSRTVQQKNWYHVYLPSPIHTKRGTNNPITNWFSQLGISRVRSYEKRIPNALFECNKTQISLFLHHLWATDGNISLKKLKGRKEAAAIYYASSSELLCQQVQQLLLRLSIQSTLSCVTSKRGYRPMYHLHVFGKAQQTAFLTIVGCAGKRGHLIPELLEKINLIKSNPNYDVIPKEAWHSVIKQAKETHRLSWREVCREINTSYCGSALFKSGISKQRMASLYKGLPSKEIESLLHSSIYWDEILSITELGIEDVYDATVEDVHNFVANDFIVHNSIEQDSDIVMFLLRREYYDAYDKPGTAELIVAKNRHGGVGSIQLTFRKEIAQFNNYSAVSSQKSESEEEDPFTAFAHK